MDFKYELVSKNPDKKFKKKMKLSVKIILIFFFLSFCSSLTFQVSRRKVSASARREKQILDGIQKQINTLVKQITNFTKSTNETKISSANGAKKAVEKEKKIISIQTQIGKLLEKASTKISDKQIKKSLKESVSTIKSVVKKASEGVKKNEKETNKLIKESKKVAQVASKNKTKIAKLEKAIAVKQEEEEKKTQHLLQKFYSKKHFHSFAEPKQSKAQTAEDVAGHVSACVSGIMASLQGPFCYKKGADFGKIPTGCAPGLERRLALCFESCRSGYSHVLGVCWGSCPGGWTDIGAICTQMRKKWIFYYPAFQAKSSYIPSSYTNFNDKATCDDGMYKGGALCYRDCGKIQYVNCGIGACSADKAACVAGIINMIVSVGVAVINCVSLVLTMGTSSAGGNQALTQASAQAVKVSATAIRSANSAVRTSLQYLKSMGSKVVDHIKSKVVDALKSKIIANICEDVLNAAMKKSEENTLSKTISRIDILGVYDTVKECKELQKDNSAQQKTSCARAALNLAGVFDPTGLLNVAAAFTYATCDGV